MILTDFALQTDRGDKLRTYIEPLAGMMVRDASGRDCAIRVVDRTTHTMTLLWFNPESGLQERSESVDYSTGDWRLSPGKNGEFEWTGVKAVSP